MKKIFNKSYQQVYQFTEQQGEDFAQIISESFDDLDSLGEFIDTLFYMHSISDDEQFASFLGIIYEIMGCQMPLEIDFHLTSTSSPFIFYNCFLSSLLNRLLSLVGGD